MLHSYFSFRTWPHVVGVLISVLTMPSVHAQSFAPVVSYPTGTRSYPNDVQAGDVNADSYLDLLTVNSLEGTVGVLLNRKDGTFAPILTYSTSEAGANSSPRKLALGDVNKDGYLDAVVSDDGLGQLGVLLNKKDGTFAPVVHYSTSTTANSQPRGIALGDVNGDGYLDLVSNNFRTSTVVVLLNKKDGTFAPFTAYSTLNSSYYGDPFLVALGDLNNDGYPDIATDNYYAQTVSVLLNKQDGTYAPVTVYPQRADTNAFNIALSDVNGDGFLDLLTASSFYGVVGVRLNRKDGTFPTGLEYPAQPAPSYPIGLAVGDLNGDGSPDIVTGDCNTSSAGPVPNNVAVLLNKKDGTFAPGVTFAVGPNASPASIVLADVNKDGKLDIITANSRAYSVSVLLNQTTLLATQVPRALSQVQVSVYPNPAPVGSTVALAVTSLPTEARRLEAVLVDAVGRVVKRSTVAVGQGEASVQLPTTSLAAGLYQVRVTVYDAQATTLASLPAQQLSLP